MFNYFQMALGLTLDPPLSFVPLYFQFLSNPVQSGTFHIPLLLTQPLASWMYYMYSQIYLIIHARAAQYSLFFKL